MSEDEIKLYLLDILEALNDRKISRKTAIDRLNQNKNLEEAIVNGNVCFCISDCYFMIKHLLEENITDIEIEYFIDCFRDKREYSLKEKRDYISFSVNWRDIGIYPYD